VITLSIIIVSYNARADLERCLTSLTDHPPAVPHEIIVVDNASTDGSAGIARGTRGVAVVESPANRGFAAANNTGIRASRGRLLLLLNSDTLVPSGAIDHLISALDSRPEVAVVGPRLVDAQGRPELSFGSMISPVTEWRRQRLMRAIARRDPPALASVESESRREQTPDWVSGACLLVRREDAEAVGLLDERFFLYTEDVDFCASIRARNRRILFLPSVEIVHLRGRSGFGDPGATRSAYERSHVAFYRKHYPALGPFIALYHRLWQ
jgi:GT2 family glycosyltransferase